MGGIHCCPIVLCFTWTTPLVFRKKISAYARGISIFLLGTQECYQTPGDGEKKVKVQGKALLFPFLRISQGSSYDILLLNKENWFEALHTPILLKRETWKNCFFVGHERLSKMGSFYVRVDFSLFCSGCVSASTPHPCASEKQRPHIPEGLKEWYPMVSMGLMSLHCFIYSDRQTNRHIHKRIYCPVSW